MFIALVILLLIAVFITVYYYQAQHTNPVNSNGLAGDEKTGAITGRPASRDEYRTAGNGPNESKA
jgi:hypothetical protein